MIPHADFDKAIERGPLALVPLKDSRLAELITNNRGISQLTSNFTDQFGRRVTPSAILIRSDAPKCIDFYAVAGFRNCIAISAVIDAWVYKLAGGNAGYPLWADYYDFYPFTAGKDGALIARSVASFESDHSDNFRGQRAPHIASQSCLSFGVDEIVLERCLQQWDRRFLQNRCERASQVLFRSLEIASQAMRVPAIGTQRPTIHDLGVGIALWVSAFEILSHPRKGNANLGTVLDLLSNVGWIDKKLSATRFTVEYPRKNYRKVNLAQKFYHELYSARNAFLHGNAVTASKLFPGKKRGGPNLLDLAPLVYRAAILAHTGSKSGAKQTVDSVAHRSIMSVPQSHYETALLNCKPQKKVGRI